MRTKLTISKSQLNNSDAFCSLGYLLTRISVGFDPHGASLSQHFNARGIERALASTNRAKIHLALLGGMGSSHRIAKTATTLQDKPTKN